MVLRASNPTIEGAIICKETHCGLDVVLDIVDIKQEQGRADDGSLGTPDVLSLHVDLDPSTTKACCLSVRCDIILFCVTLITAVLRAHNDSDLSFVIRKWLVNSC